MGRGWEDEETARRYDQHTRRFSGYRRLSERLVAFAGIEPGMHVVDLGCGTGLTTGEVLGRLGPAGRVTAVDRAAAMLGVARARIEDGRVTWVHARAEALAAVVPEPADAVLCSSALWQTPPSETLTAVRRVLRAGGALAFNLPSSFFPRLFPPGPPRRRPALHERMWAVAVLEHDLVLPERQPLPWPGDLHGLRAQLEAADLRLERWELFETETSAEEEIDWLRIPVFTDRLLPGLDYATRMAVLDRALAGYRPASAESRAWAQFRVIRT